MDFEPTDRCKEILEQVRGFMAEHVYPVEDEVIEAIDREVDVDTPFPAVLVDLRARAKAAGLWNLFLPQQHDDSPGLTNEEYGTICEEQGRSTLVAPWVFNCQPPDSGNMEILAEHATAAPARALARAAARGRDPQLLLDDRARHRGLGPDRPLVPRGARRRRVGHQRPQVVDQQRARGAGGDRDGGHRPGRRPPPAGDDAARAHGHARLQPGPPAVEHGPQRGAGALGDRLRGLPRPGRARPRSARARAASRSPRTGSGPGASTTACG